MQNKKIWFLAGLSFLIGTVATALTMQCSAWFIGALTAWIWIKVEKTPSANAVKRGALAGILGAGHIVFVPIIAMYTNSQGFKWQEAGLAAITALEILVLNSLLGAAVGYFIKKRMEKPLSKEETQTLSHSKWGIFSFLVSLVMLVMIVPVYMFSGTPLPEEVLSIPLQYFILFLYCILPAGCLLGVSLAVAGFREKNRKNLFSGLGLIMNVLASLLMLLFWMLALMVGFPLSLWFH